MDQAHLLVLHQSYRHIALVNKELIAFYQVKLANCSLSAIHVASPRLDHSILACLQVFVTDTTLSMISDLTLLMKSAASIDQPSGISCFFIWTCLAKIMSLISFLDFPL